MAVYDLDQVSVNLAGIPFVGGWGEGGSISITFNSELFVNTVGRTGEVVRSKTNDKSAVVSLTFLQTSAHNSRLGALSLLDQNLPNGAGIGPFICRDRTNGDEYFAAKAWIQKLPDPEFGQEATDREWQIFCERLDSFPGGRS